MDNKNDKIDRVWVDLNYEVCDAGATLLAASIINQAARDYKSVVKHNKSHITFKNEGSYIYEDREAFRNFFRSEWFQALTAISKVQCDGEKVIDLIENKQNDSSNKNQLVFPKRKRKNNKSGRTGVMFRNDTKKWTAEITVGYEKIKLGCYDKKEEAIKAREEAERLYYGD